SATAQNKTKKNTLPTDKSQTGVAAQDKNTPGRIAKFTTGGFVGDSNITEDGSGKIGVGTTTPTSPLTVNGVVEPTGAQGGIKFPDGTVQTTAGVASVTHDNTLKGNGAESSPLGVAVPLNLSGSFDIGSVLVVTNTNVSNPTSGSTGITTKGGAGGAGVRAQGGNSIIGGEGVVSVGG